MYEELLRILERIASSLEKISNILDERGINTFKDSNISKFLPTSNEDKEGMDTEEITERQYIIEKYLSSRNITVKHINQEDEANRIKENIALFIGNRYNSIKIFFDQVKKNMNSGGSIKMDLKNKPQEDISNICQLATMLHEIAYLEEYEYQKSPKYLLFAKPNRIPQAINFFSGQWLEIFIRSQVSILIRQTNPNIKYSYITNPQVKLPNGDDFELDILFEIEGEIYWFEAKTGDYQRYVEKYSKISRILNLNRDHSFMILTDIRETATQALTSLFGMNVIKIENFSKEFQKMIEKYSDQIDFVKSDDIS